MNPQTQPNHSPPVEENRNRFAVFGRHTQKILWLIIHKYEDIAIFDSDQITFALGMPALQCFLLDFPSVHDIYINLNLHACDRLMMPAFKMHLASLHCTSLKSSMASSFKSLRKVWLRVGHSLVLFLSQLCQKYGTRKSHRFFQ